MDALQEAFWEGVWGELWLKRTGTFLVERILEPWTALRR